MLDLESSAVLAYTGTDTALNQRRSMRHLCIDGSVMRLAVRPEFRGRLALLVDVSTTGIGFLLQDSLETGAVLVFEVKAPAGAEPVRRIARVRHCRPQPTPPEAPWLPPRRPVLKVFRTMFGITDPPPPGDAWFVGCEYDRPMDATALAQFLETLKADADENVS